MDARPKVSLGSKATEMNECIAPRRTTRFLFLCATLTLGGVLGSLCQEALARELGVEVAGSSREQTGSLREQKRIDGTALGDDPFSIPAVRSALASAPASARAPRGIVVAQNSASDPAVARLEVRLSELERDLRASTGRVEDLDHQVKQLRDRLEKLSSDVDYRLGQPGAAATGGARATAPSQRGPPSSQGTGAPGSRAGSGDGPTVLGRVPQSEVKTATARPTAPEPATPGTSSSQTAAALPMGTPREQYAHGFGLLRKANYDEAEVAFKEFLRKNPDDPLADNARYWLGETYYARGEYALAAETFLDAYQKNKAGPKAPDALLKLGMSLGSLKKIPEACATYKELKTAVPNAPVSIKNRAQKERRKLGCK